jgi:hypothetical protein
MPDSELVNIDWWARILGVIAVLIAIYGVYVSNKGAPDWFAAPYELAYSFTESNLLTPDAKRPKTGALTVKITNNGKTPARDVRVIVTPLTQTPSITSDQQYEIQDAPFGAKIVTISRVPPGTTAMVDFVDSVSEYPEASSEPKLRGPRLKYQYFPIVHDVQTEFGPVRCDYLACARFCLPLPDDNDGMPSNSLPVRR